MLALGDQLTYRFSRRKTRSDDSAAVSLRVVVHTTTRRFLITCYPLAPLPPLTRRPPTVLRGHQRRQTREVQILRPFRGQQWGRIHQKGCVPKSTGSTVFILIEFQCRRSCSLKYEKRLDLVDSRFLLMRAPLVDRRFGTRR